MRNIVSHLWGDDSNNVFLYDFQNCYENKQFFLKLEITKFDEPKCYCSSAKTSIVSKLDILCSKPHKSCVMIMYSSCHDIHVIFHLNVNIVSLCFYLYFCSFYLLILFCVAFSFVLLCFAFVLCLSAFHSEWFSGYQCPCSVLMHLSYLVHWMEQSTWCLIQMCI